MIGVTAFLLAATMQPPPPDTPVTEEERQAVLRQIEEMRRELEQIERRGEIMSSQAPPKPLAVIEREGAEAVEAMRAGQDALRAARYDDAERLLDRARILVQGLFGQNEVWATIAQNLAVTYHNQGRIAEAEAVYVRVLEWRDAAPDRDNADMAIVFQNLGSLYYDQARYDEALTVIERALGEQRARLGVDHEQTLVSQAALGTVMGAQGRRAEAEDILKDVIARMERVLGADHEHRLSALANLGVLYRTAGRFGDGEPLLRRSLDGRLRTLGRAHPDTLHSQEALGRLLREQGRFGEAEQLLAGALAVRRQGFGDEHPLTVATAASLAAARLGAGRFPGALDAARLAAAGARSRRGGAGADRYTQAQRVREEAGERGHYLLLADAAWGGDRAALRPETFLALQDSLGGGDNEAIMQMAVRRYAAAAGAGLDALLRERAELNEQWLGMSVQVGRAQADSSEAGPAARAQLRDGQARATRRLAEIDRRLAADFPDYFSLIRPQALALAATQALLRSDEAVLLAIPTDLGTHIMAVTRDGAGWARSGWNGDRIRAAAERLRWDASGTAQGDNERVAEWQARQRPDALPGFDRRTAHELYRELIAPVEPILSGKRRLYVVAGGPLAALPFSLLVAAPPEARDDDPAALRRTSWLSDRHALVHIPSVRSLALLREAAATTRSSGSFVGFGDPALAGAPAARRGGPAAPPAEAVLQPQRAPWGGMVASTAALNRMAQLPGTARELASMRTLFGDAAARIFTRAAATESAVRNADLSQASVIAFATHGLTPGDLAGDGRTASEIYELAEPGLVLTPPETASAEDDGYLAASEVSALRLNADWVILSACNSATPDDAAEPGLSSLARAFFYAGARNLLASHWPVDDAVGAIITVRTLALERAGTARAEAFQRAMREIRDDPAHPEWAHPFYWAPFVLIGDGG